MKILKDGLPNTPKDNPDYVTTQPYLLSTVMLSKDLFWD
jgi:hypothetical protein